jgi:hypothetical protein
MFSFLKAPLDRRMFALIWPRTKDIRGDHPVLIQATIAIPNLAIAATLLLQRLPREIAEATAVKIESLMFELIAADQAFYSVGEVLQLPAERNAWRMYTLSAEPSVQSNLDTIIRVVYSMRLDKYQE